MKPEDILNLSGLVLNVIGALITAFAAGNYIYSLHASIAMLETTMEAYLDNSTVVPSFRNAEKIRSKTRTLAGFWTWLGVFLVILGFVLQFAAILVAAHSAKT